MSNKEKRNQEWSARIADYRASGLTMAAWSDANGTTKEQLRYWLRKFKLASSLESSPSSVHWTPLPMSESSTANSPSLLVQVGPSRITLEPGFDPALLRAVVQALQPLC